jgi:hypothetical protein
MFMLEIGWSLFIAVKVERRAYTFDLPSPRKGA